jgi:hypothetical protein
MFNVKITETIKKDSNVKSGCVKIDRDINTANTILKWS